jgi:Zn-dependent peptidase ImmA (M78 family)
MGLRGQRQTITNKIQEPELIVGVNDIIKKAHEQEWYSGNSLNIENVVKSFEDIIIRKEQMQSNVSGYFKYENGKWIIGINQAHHPNRQKFTMAHELGHYMLHKAKDVNIVDTTLFRNDEADSVEYMANDFASKLLMPEDKVRELVDSGIKNIGELAIEFGISASAMKYRILSLGYKMRNNV